MESFEGLFAYALAKEEETAAFYGFLASLSRREHIRKVFEEFAGQEKAHRKVFEKIIKEGCRVGRLPDPTKSNLNLSDYLVSVPFSPDMSYQDALILGMKREEASRVFYEDLARSVSDACLAETIRKLAAEEASHKAKLEDLYDKEVLTED